MVLASLDELWYIKGNFMATWVKWTIAGWFALMMVGYVASLFQSDDLTKSVDQKTQEAKDGLRKIDEASCKAGNQTACEKVKKNDY
jgi:hypothetical protein